MRRKYCIVGTFGLPDKVLQIHLSIQCYKMLVSLPCAKSLQILDSHFQQNKLCLKNE